jgi:hypothetical protein
MKTLEWQTKNGKVMIDNLKQLLDVLINTKIENVDEVITKNKNILLQWLKENFPKQLELIIHLENEKFTPQQVREMLAQNLRKIS